MNFTTTIEFKSSPVFFEKEISGRKNNTVRVVGSIEDKRILTMRESIKYIRIVNSVDIDCKSSFVRKIKDITRWSISNPIRIIYIFTWEV